VMGEANIGTQIRRDPQIDVALLVVHSCHENWYSRAWAIVLPKVQTLHLSYDEHDMTLNFEFSLANHSLSINNQR
jgi:hypothetical protein